MLFQAVGRSTCTQGNGLWVVYAQGNWLWLLWDSEPENLRSDGKNYYIWRYKVDFYILGNLKRVLYAPCPIFVVETEESVEEIARSKAAREIWNKDDSLCFHRILNHLSDDLSLHYSKRRKKTSAKRLFKDLLSFHKMTTDEKFHINERGVAS
ncbi:hypothetical protein CerSpe_084660 [Prunus speciosa]